MTARAWEYLDKAIEQLSEAQGVAKAGYGNSAGRLAYLSALNAATAILADRGSLIDRKKGVSHKSINIQFATLTRSEPKIPQEFHSILPQTYDLKRIADYELGPNAMVPLERAQQAIERVSRFIDCIRGLLMSENTPRKNPGFTP